jgi:hypothetical protein
MIVVRAMSGIIALLCIAFATAPAAAQNWNKGPLPTEYEQFDKMVKVDPNRPLGARFFFEVGMAVGLQAAQEDFSKAGIAPLYCLPADLRSEVLRDLILAELKASPNVWRASSAGIEKLAIHVVRAKYPC